MDAFNYLASQHPNIQQSLVGRTLVFGQKSGISVNGEIILYSGEVRSNWLNIIKNAPSFDKLLEFLPLYERALSQVFDLFIFQDLLFQIEKWIIMIFDVEILTFWETNYLGRIIFDHVAYFFSPCWVSELSRQMKILH